MAFASKQLNLACTRANARINTEDTTLNKFDSSIVHSCVLGIDQCICRCTCQAPPFEGKGRYLHKVWLGIHQDLNHMTNQSIQHHNYN